MDSKNDIEGSSENDNEYSRVFNVTGNGNSTLYKSFEFVETRYFITKTNDSFLFGALSENNNILTLSGFGTISILSVSNYAIVFEVATNSGEDNLLLNASKASEINTTTMTVLLTMDKWILTNSSHETPDIDGIWTFTKSNSYIFEYSNGETYKKGWGYESEASIKYGNYGGPYNGIALLKKLRKITCM